MSCARSREMTLRARIALAGGLVVFLALLAASFVLYPVADRDLHRQLDSALITTVTTAPKFGPELKTQLASTEAFVTDPPIAVGDTLIQFIGPTAGPGTPTALGPVTDRDMDVAGGRLPAYFQTTTYQGQSYEMY